MLIIHTKTYRVIIQSTVMIEGYYTLRKKRAFSIHHSRSTLTLHAQVYATVGTRLNFETQGIQQSLITKEKEEDSGAARDTNITRNGTPDQRLRNFVAALNARGRNGL